MPRFSIRILLAATLVIAAGLAWYTAWAGQRSHEVAQLVKLEKATRYKFVLAEGRSEYEYHRQHSYNGIVVCVENAGPGFLRRYNLDLFKVITSADVQNEINLRHLDLLAELNNLERVSFRYSWEPDADRLPSDVREYLSRIEAFEADHPSIEVEKIFPGVEPIASQDSMISNE